MIRPWTHRRSNLRWTRPPPEPLIPAPRPLPLRPRAGWRAAPTSACWVEWRAGWPSTSGSTSCSCAWGSSSPAFFGGLGVIAYVLGWIAAARRSVGDRRPRRRGDRRQLFGYGLVALGLLAVGGRLGWSFGGDGAFWPLVLIGLGAAVLWLRTRDHARSTARRTTGPTVRRRRPGRRGHASTRPTPVTAADPDPADAGRDVRDRRPRHPDRGRTWVRSRGACSSCSPAARGCSTPPAWSTWTSACCSRSRSALVGAALVVSAWFGRSRGLIALGIPLVLVVGGFGLVDVPLAGGIGDPTYHPRTVAAVDGIVHPGHRQPLGRPARRRLRRARAVTCTRSSASVSST